MRYFIFLLLIAFTGCKPEYTAQQIVDLSINKSGLEKLKTAEISFDFRGKNYKANRNNGSYEYTKVWKQDSIVIKDVLSNLGFKRFINDSLVNLSDKDVKRYANSVNSVHYFSILPLGLNDKAVNKKLLPSVVIKGKTYYKVQVTFNQEGGGDDFDDVFLYWFNTETFKLEYLAYKYHTNGGGVRFRDVKKEHLISGVRLVDYNNYKPKENTINFLDIDKIYEEGNLKKVSEIVLENINIK
ncbi:conserved hypothetical protein [Tenacibaculum sp. 190524A02b]|uniref:Deoxyribose-phosphate aldolase n=1 Tax=Tenacibaculum vairaonense TaxID=3137860 RepID=A0ABM9PPG6_9FLAO